MTNNKILKRSKIIDIIYKLKNSENYNDKNLLKAASFLKKINDIELTISTLLKEINLQITRFDIALAYIAKIISPDITKQIAEKMLNDAKISDKKKIFLINLIRDLGTKLTYEDTAKYFAEPDKMLENEKELFIKLSGINPEAQIDFLDFFFTVSDENKLLLLDTLKNDFSDNEISNALEPIVFFNTNKPYIKYVIDILKNTKTYMSKLCLEHIIDTDSDYKQEAKTALNTLILKGLRKKITRAEVTSEYLKNTQTLGFWSSLVDGEDNFSIIYARQKATGQIATFFTTVNIINGIKCSFGFDDISITELKTILKRFFKASYMIRLEDKIGAKLLNHFEEISVKSNNTIPYEYLAWRNYCSDIKIEDFNLENLFIKDLNNVELNNEKYEMLFKKNIVETWFYTIYTNKNFEKLIETILSYKEKIDIEEINSQIVKNLNKIINSKTLKQRIIYNSYFLCQINMFEEADTLYSISNNKECFKKLKTDMVKMSIYQYFLSLRDNYGNVKNIFNDNHNYVNYKFYIDLIEEEWTK